MAINKAFADVRAFHQAFGHPAPDVPSLTPHERATKRADWIRDEVDELDLATAQESMVGQVDAYIDIIYFAIGGLVENGIQPGAIWDIVQAANMAKLGPDGKPLFHPDGKTKKPDGWVAPEPLIENEVARQISDLPLKEA